MNDASIEKFFDEIKISLTETLTKLLTHDNKTPSFDPKVVIEKVLSFIKKDISKVTQDNRYEEYYRLTGKAVTVSEAWLKNYSSEVKHFEETAASIDAYIVKTYGKQA